MALTEDSRALLQLLLGKGQSYADIADLLGVSEDEVRSRARAALTEMGDRDPDTNAPLTDYLLGQADPIARADVARHLADSPDDQELADTLAAKLRLIAPSASLPKTGRPGIAPAKKSRRFKTPVAASAGDPKPKKSRGGLDVKQRRLITLIIGVGLLVVIAILLITGAFSSDDSGDSLTNPSPTQAVLKPVNGETGKGNVEFGFSGTNLAANLLLSDLSPNKSNQSYTTWLTGKKGIAYPINQSPVGQNGKISGQVTVNQAVICFIAADEFTNVQVSRVDNSQMKATLAEAAKSNKGKGNFPKYVGTTVLSGPVVMPASAKKTVLPTCDAASAGSTTAPQK